MLSAKKRKRRLYKQDMAGMSFQDLTLCIWDKSKRVLFTNSENPVEMPHNALFQQGLQFVKVKKIFRQKVEHF